MIRRGHARWCTAAGALVVGCLAPAVLSSCTTGDAADRARRSSDVYVAVLAVVLDEVRRPADGGDDDSAGRSDAQGTGSTARPEPSTSTSGTANVSTPTSSSGPSKPADSPSRTSRSQREAKRDRLPLLFVSPLEEGQPFTLEVQAAVIERLADRALVRFVDTRRQAVDVKVDQQPTLDDGTLVRLGRVPADGDEVQVAAERYEATDAWEAMRFVVRVGESGWDATLVDRRPRPPDS